MEFINKVTEDLKKIDERLSITYDLEDMDDSDLEEYGIEDIEDTRHYSLLVSTSPTSAIIAKQYFDFNAPKSLMICSNSSTNRTLENQGLTRDQIIDVQQVLLSHSKWYYKVKANHWAFTFIEEDKDGLQY